jgi:hypothetical protein
MIFKTLHRKLKIEQHEPHSKPVLKSCSLEEEAILAPHVTPVVLLFLQTSGGYIMIMNYICVQKSIYVAIKLRIYVLLYKISRNS